MKFTRFSLDNGLRVVFVKDSNTPIAAVNIIYDVGSRDENPNKTGWAHFLEHLMFEGSENIDNYDYHVAKVGGTNNAFTDPDYTNYYISLPKDNIETALWLESDRMKNLAFKPKNFETQKKVVIEEFKETTLNAPYGDDMTHLFKLAYKKHPYQWETIGKKISHIENASLEEIREFYDTHYAPNNAILAIGGDFEIDYIKEIVNKWFGDIPPIKLQKRNLPTEPEQTERREQTIYRDVPFDVLYMAFHFGKKLSKDYYVFDILTSVLDAGKSSRFYQKLVKEKKVFDHVEAFISGTLDPELIIISGQPAEGVSMQEAEEHIWQELEKIKTELIPQKELEKTLNALELKLAYLETSILKKTEVLCHYELLGNAELFNSEKEKYTQITSQDIKEVANRVFQKNKVSVLHYLTNKNKQEDER